MAKIVLTMSLMLLTACNGVVKDFVGGATPAPPTTTPSTENGTASLKLSPGYMKATNNGIGIEANITTTKKIVSGGGISAELTLSRTRN